MRVGGHAIEDGPPPGPPESGRVAGPGRTTRVLTALAAVVVLGAVVAGVLWHLDGGRWQVVATPSMGTAAPVGTLVLTRPAATVAVGQIVTYRPPVANHPQTVTHRVVAVAPDGGFRTRGDVNGAADPWTARPADLVGVAVVVAPGLGWLVKALPLVLAGTLLLWWVTHSWVARRWGVPLRVLGLSALIAAATTILQPFVGLLTLATTADATGNHITLVSTGLLPIRATAATGGSIDLVDGQVGVLTTQVPRGANGTTVTSGVHMPVWLWILMVLFWLTPMLYGLVAAWRHPLPEDEPEDEPDDAHDPDPPTLALPVVTDVPGRRRRLGVLRPAPVLGATAVLAFLAAVALQSASTTAAFTARVTNSADTAATAPYFTCAGALTAGTADYLVWPLDDATVTNGSTARDISGNNRAGTYTNAFTTTTNKPCPRDTPARAVTLAPTATAQSYVASSSLLGTVAPTVFSTAIWFRTTTATGGRLMGWGNLRTGQSTTDDRHLYMTDSGQIAFGVTSGSNQVVTSAKGYNDGQWHLAVATLSGAGMVLYLDGAAVGTNAAVTTADGGLLTLGFWRVGWDNLATWPNRPTTDYWTGSLADAAVYTSALTATQVAQLYAAGT